MAKDTFNQSMGFIKNALHRSYVYDDIAGKAAARGDDATAARFRGKANAEGVRAEKTIENEIKKLR